MKITATPAGRYTGNTHAVVSSQADIRHLWADKSGTVRFSVNTSRIGLSGRFTLDVEIPWREIQSFYRAAETGPLLARIEELEAEVSKLKGR